MKEKEIVVQEVVKQRKKKKDIYRKHLSQTKISHNRTYTQNNYPGKCGTKAKQKPKKRKNRYCYAPNWNPNQNCLARNQNVKTAKRKGTSRKPA